MYEKEAANEVALVGYAALTRIALPCCNKLDTAQEKCSVQQYYPVTFLYY